MKVIHQITEYLMLENHISFELLKQLIEKDEEKIAFYSPDEFSSERRFIPPEAIESGDSGWAGTHREQPSKKEKVLKFYERKRWRRSWKR
jgi:hypothetical protein